MPDPIITLTTDFGEDAPYVAAVKGAVLLVNPAARLVDLSHRIPPQDLRHAAYFLATSIPYFPPAIHVVIVDPGVGGERAALCIEAGGHRLLVPDNGCWIELAQRLPDPLQVRRLEESRFWRQPVSRTFHGRDVFAPVAGHLSLGLEPAELGPLIEGWAELPIATPRLSPGRIAGEVRFVDWFGNLITNIPADTVGALGQGPLRTEVAGQPIHDRVRTYSEGPPGAPVLLTSSEGSLEIAVNQGSAARLLGAGVGTPVTVESTC